MSIKFWVIDVDGTMTDSGIIYDEQGNELKKFSTKDAAAFFAVHAIGMKIIVLTGRECVATKRRMLELKVDYLFQGVKDKRVFLKEFMESHNITKDEIGYIGDDLNDYYPMHLAGYIACPKDSCKEIIDIADYVSSKNGGDGAVRDIIETFLRGTGQWMNAISNVYNLGV